MAIRYIEQDRTFWLDTEHTSYLLAIVDQENFVGHVYYGQKLQYTENTPAPVYLLRTGEAPFVPSQNNRERVSFLDSFPMEYPGNGLGDYRESAISVRTAQGHVGVQLQYVSHEIVKEKPALPGLPSTFPGDEDCDTLILHLADPVIGLAADLIYTTFEEEDVITRSVILKNTAGQPIYVTKVMSACLDLDCTDEKYDILTLHGSWARERQMERRSLMHGKQSVGSVRGESSHQEHPFIALLSADATQDAGEVYGMHFVYSGNFLAQAELSQFDSIRMTMGIHPENFVWKLEQGESFAAPEVVMTYSSEGLSGMTHHYHDMYRGHLIRGEYRDKKRPILINNWEATYFDFNEDKLVELMGDAVKLGVDMFLLDDGWFGNKYERHSDTQGLGDWDETQHKLPHGIQKLVDEAAKRNIKFGIWIEPEMVNPKSELYEKHKDWVIHLPNRDEYYFRNQMVLDLSNPKVQDFVYGVVDKILTENPEVAFFKWDCNSPITNVYSPYLKNKQGQLYIDHVRGIYNVLKRIKDKYPNVPMMLCSGGGARCDYEALKYFTEFWCSDNTDPIERLFIQWGFSQIFPAKAMCAHVTSWNKNTSVKFRTDVASMCKLGFDLGLKELNADEQTYCQNAVANWTRLKKVILDGDQYRLVSPYDGNHMSLMYASPDKNKAVLYTYDIHPRFGEKLLPVKLQGLDAKKMYKVKEINLMPNSKSNLAANEKTYSGDYLMKVGINAFTTNQAFSRVIELTAE